MMLKLPLKNKKFPAGHARYPWASCVPFVDNSRGLLVHRPKSVATFKTHKHSHIAVTYWCGNTSAGENNFTFLESPPDGKLLCDRCESAAVASGLPSASELAGRHVHTGSLKAIRTCCNERNQL